MDGVAAGMAAGTRVAGGCKCRLGVSPAVWPSGTAWMGLPEDSPGCLISTFSRVSGAPDVAVPLRITCVRATLAGCCLHATFTDVSGTCTASKMRHAHYYLKLGWDYKVYALPQLSNGYFGKVALAVHVVILLDNTRLDTRECKRNVGALVLELLVRAPP
jgi:hypothetical protein